MPTTQYKKLLLEAYGLPKDATDTQIEAAIANSRALATNAEQARQQSAEANVALNTALRASEEEVTRFRALAVNALLADGINTGKLSAADADGMREAFAVNFDATALLLEKKATVLNTKSLNMTLRDCGYGAMSPQQRQAAFNARIAMLTRPIAQQGMAFTFEQAVEYMRANADDLSLLRAMDNSQNPR